MYITNSEVVGRYPVIKTKFPDSSAVNSQLVYYAEIELNGRLAGAFDVPFSVGHPTVKDLAIDLCYYRALLSLDPGKAKELNEAIIGRIDDIKDGKEFIYTGSGTHIEASGDADDMWSNTMDYHATHSMLDEDSGYTHVSSSLIYDEESER